MKAATPPWTRFLRSLRRSEYPLIVSSLSSIWLDSQVSVSTMASIFREAVSALSNSQIKAFYEDLRSRGREVSIKTHCVKFDQLLPSCQLSQSAIYRRIRRFAAIFCYVWRWLKREGISSRWVTHVAQKPQLSKYEANRFLDSFRTKLQLKKNHKCLRKKDKMMAYSSLPPRRQPVLSLFQFKTPIIGKW